MRKINYDNKKFIKIYEKNDSIGDLARDILDDAKFPFDKTGQEIFDYLNFKTLSGGTHETLKEFLSAYNSYNTIQIELKE